MRDRTAPTINPTTEGPWGNKATTIKGKGEGGGRKGDLSIRFYLLCILADLYFSGRRFSSTDLVSDQTFFSCNLVVQWIIKRFWNNPPTDDEFFSIYSFRPNSVQTMSGISYWIDILIELLPMCVVASIILWFDLTIKDLYATNVGLL